MIGPDEMKHWIKLWDKILDSVDFMSLPDDAKWVFIGCCLLANREGAGGFLPPLKKAAFILRTNEASLKGELVQLAMSGLVELRVHPSGEERYFVTNYDHYQSQATVDGRERTRQWRANKRQKELLSSSPSSETNSSKKKIYKEEEEGCDVSVTSRHTHVTRQMLKSVGIAWNDTTKQLTTLDYVTPDYLNRHVKAARKNNEPISYAIRRMLDGDPAPDVCPKCGAPLKTQVDPYTGRVSGFCSKSYTCDYRFSEEDEEEDQDYQYEENGFYSR